MMLTGLLTPRKMAIAMAAVKVILQAATLDTEGLPSCCDFSISLARRQWSAYLKASNSGPDDAPEPTKDERHEHDRHQSFSG
ncbi:hypothetical protein O3S81_01760 [Agrobacterium sp. SOY23]|uniref:hypothetical protein n=1 Tax=Agrobacterium sp. SOY23 TaxID=3014555 RepID=UPI0022B02A83|nr:hypothetical protein [Agrobacterium sp. SOY23]MCZ4428418.1 hypothetical protein [Agrobacterium sp. SOY23]